jgi:hypothetical protein
VTAKDILITGSSGHMSTNEDNRGPTVTTSDQSRPYDLAWVVLDHARVTQRFGWRTARSTASILAEIAGSSLPAD